MSKVSSCIRGTISNGGPSVEVLCLIGSVL